MTHKSVRKEVLNVNIEKFFNGKVIRTSEIVSVDLRVKTKRGKTAFFKSALLTPKRDISFTSGL